MPIWPFKQSNTVRMAEKLLDAVVVASRRRENFGETKAPDTLEGRFELMALNAALVLLRLRGEAQCTGLAQTFTDRFFSRVDAGLREAAVGDLAVPKRMHKLAGAFYGRLDAYTKAIDADDRAALEAAISRNIFGGKATPFAHTLAALIVRTAAFQARLAPEQLAEDGAWPALERN